MGARTGVLSSCGCPARSGELGRSALEFSRRGSNSNSRAATWNPTRQQESPHRAGSVALERASARSQPREIDSSRSCVACNTTGSIAQTRSRPTRMLRTTPARSITSRCLLTACLVTAAPALSFDVESGPRMQSRFTSARRTSSPSAAKIDDARRRPRGGRTARVTAAALRRAGDISFLGGCGSLQELSGCTISGPVECATSRLHVRHGPGRLWGPRQPWARH
jgi:hypothetical protein